MKISKSPVAPVAPSRAQPAHAPEPEAPKAQGAWVPRSTSTQAARTRPVAPFDPRAPTSAQSVRFAAELAQAAYLGAPEFKARAPELGLTQAHFFDASTNAHAKDAQAGVGVVPGVGIFIAYRGSESATDWLRDASAAHRAAGDFGKGQGAVHSGFAQQTDDLWQDISDSVKKTIEANPGLPVYFVGHSLGGAVARLAVSRVMGRLDEGKLPGSIGGVYTFGAPAVGDEAFEKQWVERLAGHGGKYVRVRNDDDPVPLMPAIRFKHASEGVLDLHLQADGKVERKNDFSGNAMRRVARAAGALVSANDHFMGNYLSALQAWSDRER